MRVIGRQLNSGSELSTLPAAYCEPRWYAAYTSANHEKRVAEQLVVRSVEHFPSGVCVGAAVERPASNAAVAAVSGYVFVRMALQDRLRVQQVPEWRDWWGLTGRQRRCRKKKSRRCVPALEVGCKRSRILI